MRLATPARMPSFGYKLMSEEHGPNQFLHNARRALELGFDFVAISDHFHPWVGKQGHAPSAWTVLGAGENLNEHIVGAGWPAPHTRQAMLAEAIQSDSRTARDAHDRGAGAHSDCVHNLQVAGIQHLHRGSVGTDHVGVLAVW
jgi:hypothetical protein